MTLYEYLTMYECDCTELGEVTVFDREYDIEVYFYRPTITDDKWDWGKAMNLIAQKLDIVGFCKRGVIVNLSDVIERNIDNGVFKDLFICNDVDSIMDDIENIFSGCVSDSWLNDFANSLDNKEE